MRAARILVLGGVLLVATIAWRLPLAWVAGWLPGGWQCREPAGTPWAGSCGWLQTPRLYLENVGWQVQPAALLRGQLRAAVTIDDRRVSATGRAALDAGGSVLLQAVRFDAALSRSNFPQLRVAISGRATGQIATLQWRRGEMPRLAASAQLRQLRQEQGGVDLGSYQIDVHGDGGSDALLAEFHDLGGPLEVSAGRLRLKQDGQYQLDARVAARPAADPGLRRQLEFLGPPDNAGRRLLSVAGVL